MLDHADALDRLSLSCIHHLFRRLGDAPLLIVLAAPDRDSGARPWLCNDGFDAPLDAEAGALTDAYAVHAALFERVLAALQPLEIALEPSGQAKTGRAASR